jgi:RNA polymerase sigma-B factor
MTAGPKRDARRQPSTADLIRTLRQKPDPAVREQLALSYGGLARFVALKFTGRGEPLEDLIQVAQVGLLQALDRYDPDRGVEFSTFATATIAGEIKRYFRDKSWAVHVPRGLRERNNALMRVVERLAARLGRSPTIAEIAEEGGMPFEAVVEALEVGRAYSPVSLDAEVGPAGDDAGGQTLADQVGAEDPDLERFEDRQTFTAALAALPEREQAILRMRYYEERSQAEIARRLGISQMHVSRLQRAGLQRLAALLGVSG